MVVIRFDMVWGLDVNLGYLVYEFCDELVVLCKMYKFILEVGFVEENNVYCVRVDFIKFDYFS